MTKNIRQPLVILAGPTAVGKTKLSISLAKELNGEIISADSMQVYRRMDIGTAKITEAEMQGVRHHLIDCLEPTQDFNVVLFQKMVKEKMAEISARGKLPILVGGTGFYIQAVLYDIDFSEQEEDTSYREELERIVSESGAEYLHQMLKKVDPVAAAEIHPNNVKRVIRALEYQHLSGEMISKHNEEQRKKESPYDFYYFVLSDDRKKLYERIDQRVDQMMEMGLVEEVRGLLKEGVALGSTAMQGLGYKEIAAYLNGECSLEETVYCLKRDTRHFAKRQLTWFKREEEVIWLNRNELGSEEAILNKALSYINHRGE